MPARPRLFNKSYPVLDEAVGTFKALDEREFVSNNRLPRY